MVDLRTGEVARFWSSPHTNPVRGLVYAPDMTSPAREELLILQGNEVVGFDAKGEVTNTDVYAGSVLHSIDASPDGTYLATGSWRDVQFWKRKIGGETVPISLGFHFGRAGEVAFSQDGLMLATAQIGGLVRVWRHRFHGSIPDVYCPTAWTPEGEYGSNREAFSWRYRRTGNRDQSTVSTPTAWPATRVLINCDSSLMVPIQLNGIGNLMTRTASWAVGEFKLVASGFSTGGVIEAGAFSPTDSNLLVTAHLVGGRKGAGEIAFWDATTGREVRPRIALPVAPRDVAISPDGEQLAVVCSSGEVFTAPIHAPKESPKQLQSAVHYLEQYTWNNGRITFSPDGRHLLAWGFDALIRVWDSGTGEPRPPVIQPPRDAGGVARNMNSPNIVFGQDGVLGAGMESGGTELHWWSLCAGMFAPQQQLSHPAKILDMFFTKDREHLVTACREGQIRVWNWHSGSLVSAFEHTGSAPAAALTKFGNVISGGEDRALQVWQPLTARALSPRLSTQRNRTLVTVQVGEQEFALAGSIEGGVFGYELSKFRQFEHLSLNECLEIAELIAGRRITESESVARLTSAEWIERWNQLAGSQHEFLRRSYPVNKVAWHRWMSDQAESPTVRDWHREQLRQLEPEITAALDLVEDRRVAAAAHGNALEAGENAARQSDWAAARHHFETAMEAAGDLADPNDWLNLAPVFDKLGDRDAYFKLCTVYVKKFQGSEDPWELRLGPRLYFGLPSAPDESLRQVVLGMARRAAELSDEESSAYPFGALALGLAELRMGNFSKAVEWLEIAQEGPEFCRIPAHAYRALAALRLGQPDEAAEHLRKAEEGAAQLITNGIRSGEMWVEMALEEARAAIAGGGSE